MTQDNSTQIAVIGAGIVGISTALTLQRAGYQVLLIDKQLPGQETSFGNAGLLATSTLVPLNNPSLWSKLPSMLIHRCDYLNYDWRYLLKNLASFTRYLSYTGTADTQERAAALKALIYPSITLHQQWMQEAGISHRLRNSGWLKLYPNTNLFRQASIEHHFLQQNQVDTQILDADEIRQLEPDIADSYVKALWVRDSLSIDNPAVINQAYFNLFIEAGGQFEQNEVKHLDKQTDNNWKIIKQDDQTLTVPQLVLCLGPWSADFFKQIGFDIPMIYERGAHRMFKTIPDKTITRPILDTEGGFVISPMQDQYRMTCGVYLSDHNSPYNFKQLNKAESLARQRFPLGEPDAAKPDWTGCRPTLPDYLPMIGQTIRSGLWLNVGHHHIGLTMAPASAQQLLEMIQSADQMQDSPYAPQRFNC